MSHRTTWAFIIFMLASTPAIAGLDAREVHIRRLLGEGRYLEGYRIAAKTVDREPDGNRFYQLLAEAGQYAGKAHEADSILTAYARRGRDVSSALSSLGWLDVHGGRWSDACEHFKASVSIVGPTTIALAGIQEMEERLHGGDAAISHLLALSHSSNGAAPVWYALALAYWGEWDLARAQFAVERSLRSGATDCRVQNLRQAIECALDPGPRSRGRAAVALADAQASGDWEGLAFLHWVQMNAFDAAGLPDSAAEARAAGMKDARRLGLLGWEGQFYLQAGRVAVARGDISAAIASADSASACFAVAGEFDGTLAAYSLRMTILLESSRFPEALVLCFRALQQLDGRADPRLHAGAAIDAAWILSQIGGQRIALVLGVHAENMLENLFYAAHDRSRLFFVLARVHASLGDVQIASRYARTGLQIAAGQTDDQLLLANAEGVLGDIERVCGNLSAARRHYVRQWEIASRLANLGEKKTASLALARLAVLERQQRDAREWTDRAYALALSAGDRIGEGECHLIRGSLAELNGRQLDARGEYAAARLCLSPLRRLRAASSLTREMKEWYVDQHVRLATGLLHTGDVPGATAVMALARLDVQPWLVWSPEDYGPSGDDGSTSDLENARRAASGTIHRWVLQGREVATGPSDSAVQALSAFFTRTLPAFISTDEDRTGMYSSPEMQARLLGAIRGKLRQEEVALEFLFGATMTDVIVMTRDTVRGDTIPSGIGAFREFSGEGCSVGMLRTREENPGDRSNVKSSLATLLHRSIGTRKDFVIVGSGPQTCVPFESCVGETLPAGRSSAHVATFRHVPSLLGDHRSRARGPNNERVLVVGDAYAHAGNAGPDESIVDPEKRKHVSGLLEALPGAATEISILERFFGSRVHVLRGPDATMENLRVMASRCAIIHIATHGVARAGEASEHGIFLSGSDHETGILRIEDILSMDLRASLVVLPACYSGRPSGAGDVESIAEAFLEAGARSVLAARGAVDDEGTAEYIGEFYAAIVHGESVSGAAQSAAAALVRRGRIHAAAQADFLLLGDGDAVPVQSGSESGGNRWWLVMLATGTIGSIVLWFAWKKYRLRA
jgi:tetratricopeptide (TPR) repeat protein